MRTDATTFRNHIWIACRLAVAACLWLLASPGPAQTSNDEQSVDDAAEGLSQLLNSLQGLTKQLPDRSLSGNVRIAWDIGYSDVQTRRTGHCSGFGTFSLKPSSMEGYPIGQWSSRDGEVSASTSMASETTPEYGARRTARWQGSGQVEASVNIQTFKEPQTYTIRFSSANIPVTEVHQTEGHPPREFQGRQCDMAISVEDQPLPQPDQPFAGSFRDRGRKLSISWDFGPNRCKSGETPPPPETFDTPPGRSATLQAAVVSALGRASGAGPDHVSASWIDNDVLPTYVLRVAADGCLLPSKRSILGRCSRPGEHEGASRLTVGAIQQAGGTTRATVRIFDVETGVIESTGKADADGTGPDALEAAIAGSIADMGRPFACARSR